MDVSSEYFLFMENISNIFLGETYLEEAIDFLGMDEKLVSQFGFSNFPKCDPG